MRVAWLGLLLSIAPCAHGLPLLWDCPIESAAYGLPVAAHVHGEGPVDIVLTTRFDGAVKIIGSNGALRKSYVREQWMEGSIAATRSANGDRMLFVCEDSTGAVYLSDLQGGLNLRAELEGEARVGSSPCFADLDASGNPGIVVARRNGLVTAFDAQLTPLWQYDAGAPIDSSPAVAPIYTEEAVVYTLTADGVLHAVSGRGWPLWRFAMASPSPKFPSKADPLVVYLGQTHASVLIGDRDGHLYAIDANDGTEQWRVDVGGGALGTPAITSIAGNDARVVIALSEQGAIAVIDGDGALVSRAKLPKGNYVPRPVVADVDGSGKLDLLAADSEWHIVVASLNGTVKERIDIQGNAREGLVLADLHSDGILDLLAATDCGRLYCFSTKARSGWMNPRANFSCNGTVAPIVPSPDFPVEAPTRKAASVHAVTITDYLPNMPLGAAVVDIGRPPRVTSARAVIRLNGTIVGSTTKDIVTSWFTTPFAQTQQGLMTLDLGLFDRKGRLLSSVSNVPIRASLPKPIELASPDILLASVAKRAANFVVPSDWQIPTIQDRDSWSVVRYMPEAWKAYGLDIQPFITEAIPRIAAPASAPFGPKHPAWDAIKTDTKPFFVMNDYFRPEAPYRREDYDAITQMAGPRFLGFPVHEWAYAAWKGRLETAQPPPENRAEATAILKRYFDEDLDLCHGNIYAGEGYCLFHHQAYAWGAPMCYAEIGENIPCASLQFAFLRGASRENGARPWGAYLSNWFRGAVADTRFVKNAEPVRWSPPDLATGPDCGHSPNLEFRLEMAAHLAGATLVHHESDGHNGSIFMKEDQPGQYSLSSFGEAMKDWYAYSRQFRDRGEPYTPIAFMIDFDHGWRPREDIYGIWPQRRADRSVEKMFANVFPWGGRLDFERGYLANGPYGDIFDVITDHAAPSVLDNYGVIWPVGDIVLSSRQQEELETYVRQGGILVVDSAIGRQLSVNFLGLHIDSSLGFATQVQSALGEIPPLTAPYRYRPITAYRHMEVLAWTEAGVPLLAWRRVGKGLLIVSGTDHWLDERERLLPVADTVLRALSDAYLPVALTGDVEMMLSRTHDGWIVALINNNGVTKTPTRPMVVSAAGARDCLIRFKEKVMLSFTPRMGDVIWNPQENALNVRLRPGGVGVVEVKISNKD